MTPGGSMTSNFQECWLCGYWFAKELNYKYCPREVCRVKQLYGAKYSKY